MAAKQPQRYVYTEDGRWQNLPALAYAEKLGLYYRIRLDTEIDWLKYRNRLFLKAYTQPLHQLDSVRSGQILSRVSSHPGITYWELLNSSDVDADEINVLIATGKIYIDLSAAPLAEPEKVLLFTDQPTAYAYSQMIDSLGVRQIFPSPTQANPPTSWKNSLASQSSISASAMEYFLKASPEAYQEANRKYQVIKSYLNGAKRSDESETVSRRTIARWKALFKRAQASYGCGYVGLIDRQMDKGNRLPRISPEAEEFMEKIIEEHYETIKQKGKLAVYGTLAREWEKAGRSDKLPSYATFNTRIKKRSGYQQTKQRSGSRAAYQQSPFYWELKLTTPRHGDRHLPLRQEPKLEQHYEYLFSGSVGCVGILKNWLTRSLLFAYAEEARTLKLKHLKQGALGASRLKKIKEEAEQGLRRFLSESSLFEQPYSREHRPQRATIKHVPSHSRVGQRKPLRDAVGVNLDGN